MIVGVKLKAVLDMEKWKIMSWPLMHQPQKMVKFAGLALKGLRCEWTYFLEKDLMFYHVTFHIKQKSSLDDIKHFLCDRIEHEYWFYCSNVVVNGCFFILILISIMHDSKEFGQIMYQS